MKHKKWLILFVIIISICFAGKILILDNTDLLFTIAEGLEQPSKSYYLVMERIYKLSAKERLEEKINKYLEDDKNSHLHDRYIHTLGIIGGQKFPAILIKAYVQYQDDPDHILTVPRIIDSMGIVGVEDVVPILEKLLSNYDRHRVRVTRYAIVRALYLATGKAYEYTNSSGGRTKLELTNELEDARRVILESRNRDRTFEEMKSLDKVFRPPGW